MRKKNGFTLVELLAVIVVLALIIVLTIPAILDVMNSARRENFVLFAKRVVTDVQTEYTYDASSTIAGAGYYVYSITEDLGRLEKGKYNGFVVVDATDVDNPRYILTMWDSNYQIVNYDTSRGLPNTDTAELTSYSAETIEASANSALKVCAGAAGANGVCYNRHGYRLSNN